MDGGLYQDLQRTQSTASRRKEMPRERMQALATGLSSLDGDRLEGMISGVVLASCLQPLAQTSISMSGLCPSV